jgi:small subunit ribosomal protein S17
MSEATEKKETKIPVRRTLKGHVVSDKMDKTIVVKVERKMRHRLYEKIMTRAKKYHAHDRNEEAGIGDFVQIEETRPLSKQKRWRLLKIIEKAR